ncbi:MAG: dihydrofolate reductase family protein [Gemmatimonadaceae bacterium]|nr:dihydrofolate reductase family protein [Gemmatimonadaceae bacterium]
MPRIIYDVAVTLDGFIAGRDDDVSIFPHTGDHVDAYQARLAQYSTVLMGRRTYEIGYRYGMRPGDLPYPHMAHHVLSRTLALPYRSPVRVIRDDWVAHARTVREGPGGDVYLCGGGMLAGLLARHGLVDLLRLKVAPIIAGDGIPLFAGLDRPLALHRRSATTHASGVTYLEFAIARD